MYLDGVKIVCRSYASCIMYPIARTHLIVKWQNIVLTCVINARMSMQIICQDIYSV